VGKDTPDWGGIYNSQQFYPLFDMAELAARLGSPITYDRRGSLIWHYDFTDGIGDVGPAGVLGGGVVLEADVWEHPPFCCELFTGASAISQASIERRIPIPQSLRVGFQASLRVGPGVDLASVILEHFDGSTRHNTWLQYKPSDATLKVLTLGSVNVTLSSAVPNLTTGYYFAHFKVVADLSDHSLVRGLLDTNEYDLSGYTMSTQADASAPHIRGKVLLANTEAVAASLWVDSMIFTAAEP
jgi:hypothetical protein